MNTAPQTVASVSTAFEAGAENYTARDTNLENKTRAVGFAKMLNSMGLPVKAAAVIGHITDNLAGGHAAARHNQVEVYKSMPMRFASIADFLSNIGLNTDGLEANNVDKLHKGLHVALGAGKKFAGMDNAAYFREFGGEDVVNAQVLRKMGMRSYREIEALKATDANEYAKAVAQWQENKTALVEQLKQQKLNEKLDNAMEAYGDGADRTRIAAVDAEKLKLVKPLGIVGFAMGTMKSYNTTIAGRRLGIGAHIGALVKGALTTGLGYSLLGVTIGGGAQIGKGFMDGRNARAEAKKQNPQHRQNFRNSLAKAAQQAAEEVKSEKAKAQEKAAKSVQTQPTETVAKEAAAPRVDTPKTTEPQKTVDPATAEKAKPEITKPVRTYEEKDPALKNLMIADAKRHRELLSQDPDVLTFTKDVKVVESNKPAKTADPVVLFKKDTVLTGNSHNSKLKALTLQEMEEIEAQNIGTKAKLATKQEAPAVDMNDINKDGIKDGINHILDQKIEQNAIYNEAKTRLEAKQAVAGKSYSNLKDIMKVAAAVTSEVKNVVSGGEEVSKASLPKTPEPSVDIIKTEISQSSGRTLN
jgi:hypothetical protein